MPFICESVTANNSKTFGCLCCTSGPLSATVHLPRAGYAPGEIIPVSAEIENLSDKVMNKTGAKLIQDIIFYAYGGKRKCVERKIQVPLYLQLKYTSI